MSRTTKIVLSAAVGLAVAIVVVSMIGTAASGPSGPPAQPGQPASGPSGQPARPGQPAPTGRPAGPSGGHSPAYNEGYESGIQYIGPSRDVALNGAGQFACGVWADQHSVAKRDMQDWSQGCMDGVRDSFAGQ